MLKQLINLFIKKNGRSPNAIEMLQLKFKAAQQSGKGQVIQFPRDRITDWRKAKPTPDKNFIPMRADQYKDVFGKSPGLKKVKTEAQIKSKLEAGNKAAVQKMKIDKLRKDVLKEIENRKNEDYIGNIIDPEDYGFRVSDGTLTDEVEEIMEMLIRDKKAYGGVAGMLGEPTYTDENHRVPFGVGGFNAARRAFLQWLGAGAATAGAAKTGLFGLLKGGGKKPDFTVKLRTQFLNSDVDYGTSGLAHFDISALTPKVKKVLYGLMKNREAVKPGLKGKDYSMIEPGDAKQVIKKLQDQGFKGKITGIVDERGDVLKQAEKAGHKNFADDFKKSSMRKNIAEHKRYEDFVVYENDPGFKNWSKATKGKLDKPYVSTIDEVVDLLEPVVKKAEGGRVPFSKGKVVKGLAALMDEFFPGTTKLGQTSKPMAEKTQLRQAIAGFQEREKAAKLKEMIKNKYQGRIDDDLLNKILVDDNPQRIAEVLATIDEALLMQGKGMGPETIMTTLRDSWKRKKNASGGRVSLSSGGVAGMLGE